MNYNKTSKSRTQIFRNARQFEINFGHNGFRVKGLFMNFFIYYKKTNMFCVRKTNVSQRCFFTYTKHIFDKEKTEGDYVILHLPPYNLNVKFFRNKISSDPTSSKFYTFIF